CAHARSASSRCSEAPRSRTARRRRATRTHEALSRPKSARRSTAFSGERATPDLRNAVAIEGGHVTALRMAGANLDDLELVAPLTPLVVLDLHDEKIERIDGLDAMAELDHLDLSGNRIAAIERVSALHSLRSL